MMKYALVFATVLAAGLALPLERDADVPISPTPFNKTDSFNATTEAAFTGATTGATFTTVLPTAAITTATEMTTKAGEKNPMKLTMTRDISKDKAVVKDEINSLDTAAAAGNAQEGQNQDQKRDINNAGMNAKDNNMAANENRQAREESQDKLAPPKITMTREVGKDKAVVKDEVTNTKDNEMMAN